MTPQEALWGCGGCRQITKHSMSATPRGVELGCTVCQKRTSLSHDDMRQLLAAWTSSIAAPAPTQVPSVEGIRVFIQAPDGAGEAELAPQFIRQHAEITGTLPEAGKPLYARLKGLPAAISAVPYGKVVRVEKVSAG